jgi:hypothetical protein
VGKNGQSGQVKISCVVFFLETAEKKPGFCFLTPVCF